MAGNSKKKRKRNSKKSSLAKKNEGDSSHEGTKAQDEKESSTNDIEQSLFKILWRNSNKISHFANVVTVLIAVGTFCLVSCEVNQLNESLKTNTSSGIYNHNSEITSMLVKYPYMLEFFEFIDMDPLELSDPCDFAKLQAIDVRRRAKLKEWENSEDEKVRDKHDRIQVARIKYADLFDQAFVLRQSLEDWDYWWIYFCHAYDHHFLIKKYFEDSESMYSIDDALKPIKVGEGDHIDYKLTWTFRRKFLKGGDLFGSNLDEVKTERHKFITGKCGD